MPYHWEEQRGSSPEGEVAASLASLTHRGSGGCSVPFRERRWLCRLFPGLSRYRFRKHLHVRRVAYILVLLIALAAPAIAHASPSAVIRDCADDGDLDRHYSNSDLDKAEKNLPSDLDEYSDCRSVIAGAKTGGSDKGGGRSNGSGGGGGGATGAAAKNEEIAARNQDRAALDALTKNGKKPRLEIGGHTVEPGSNGLFNLASGSNGLPLPMLLALIAVGVLTATGGFFALRRRVPALARIPLPRFPAGRFDLSRVPFARSRR
jgi:hypothetical protein